MDLVSPSEFIKKPDNVRIADLRDETEIMRLMNEAHQEQPLAALAPQKLSLYIKVCTYPNVAERKGIIGVIDGKEGIEAYFFAIFGQWWFSDEWRIEELSTYVGQDFRGGSHFTDLIQFAKWSAQTFNMPLIMGITASKKLLPKIRLYERLFPPFGGLFYYRPNTTGIGTC